MLHAKLRSIRGTGFVRYTKVVHYLESPFVKVTIQLVGCSTVVYVCPWDSPRDISEYQKSTNMNAYIQPILLADTKSFEQANGVVPIFNKLLII